MRTITCGARWPKFIAALAMMAILGLSTRPAEGIVTSDGHGSHLTTPGVPAFGVNVDGVVQLQHGSLIGGGGHCTGALIGDRHVLTAAHCADAYGGASLLANAQVRFDLDGGSTTVEVSGMVIHPLWTGDTITGGHDIAVLELATAAPAAAPRYDLFTGTNEVGQTHVKVGYGTAGFGETGGDAYDNRKRAGLNLYDTNAHEALMLAGIPPLPVAESILVYDFDNGLAGNDTFGALGIPELGFGDDEILGAPGDSGGPTFILESGTYRIAGVTSFGRSVSDITDTDVDATPGNFSWGEVGGDTRVSSFVPFIEDAVAGVIDPVRGVIVSDGQTHTVDSPGNDLFKVLTGPGPGSIPSTLNVTATGSLGTSRFDAVSAAFNSKVNILGGTVNGSVALQHDADFTITGGAVHGDKAVSDSGNFVAGANSTVTVAGGMLSGSSIGLEMGDLSFFPSTSVATIDGGTIRGGQTGLVAGGASTVNMSGGAIEGGLGGDSEERGIEAKDQAQVTISGGKIDGSFGVVAFQDAAIHVSGGAAVTGSVTGVFAAHNATITIDGGAIQGGQTGDDLEDGIQAQGQAEVSVFDGTINSTYGISAYADAAIQIYGGTITGLFDGVYAQDNATVDILGGQIVAEQDFGVDALGDAAVTITGGVIDSGYVGVVADEAAIVDIHGGTILGESVDLMAIGPDATIRIFGNNFSQPLGPLGALSGSFSGEFRDGTPFNHTFERVEGGTILLISVPEPATAWLLALGGLVHIYCVRRRHKPSRKDPQPNGVTT